MCCNDRGIAWRVPYRECELVQLRIERILKIRRHRRSGMHGVSIPRLPLSAIVITLMRKRRHPREEEGEGGRKNDPYDVKELQKKSRRLIGNIYPVGVCTVN